MIFLAFFKKIHFDGKLRNITQKVTSNKIKHKEAEKKLVNLSKKVSKILIKRYNFLLGRMYFTGDDGYQSFLAFSPILNLLKLNNNKKLLAGNQLEYLQKSLNFLILVFY